jgi:hypothetical protein
VRLPTRIGLLIAVAALVAVLPTAAGALPAESAGVTANTQNYEDSTGETHPSADISRITVSNTDVGVLTFRFNMPGRSQLGQDLLMILYVDTDNNAQTGAPTGTEDPPGADYVIEIARGEPNLFRWDGTAFTRRFGDPSSVTLSGSFSNNGVNVRINASELGNTKRFRFYVFFIAGLGVDPTTGELFCPTPPCPFDEAPTFGAGLFSYQVIAAKPTLIVQKLATTPKRPTAGKRFTMKVTAVRSDTKAVIRNGKVTCRGRAGKTALKAQVARVLGGAITCTWLIPAKAKGKTFRGSAAVRFEGLTATRSYSARIR